MAFKYIENPDSTVSPNNKFICKFGKAEEIKRMAISISSLCIASILSLIYISVYIVKGKEIRNFSMAGHDYKTSIVFLVLSQVSILILLCVMMTNLERNAEYANLQ